MPTEASTGLCAANGIDMHYVRTGGRKPPLVLLHGLTGSGACWSPLARSLEDEYDVVMPDARGHGNSSTPAGYRYEDHAGDVAGLIRGLALAGPVLLGHSMGGMTAALAASQGAAAIQAVILADPTFLSPARQREVHESDVLEQHRRLLGLDQEQVLAQALLRHPRRSRELVELLVAARRQTRPEAFQVLTPPSPDYREVIGSIRVPILLVIGDRDALVSPAAALELTKLNPRLWVEQIPGAGHGLVYDQPEHFASLARAFLRAVA